MTEDERVDKSKISPVSLHDQEGDPLALSAVDGLKVDDVGTREILMAILRELQMMNRHLQIITDEDLKEEEDHDYP